MRIPGELGKEFYSKMEGIDSGKANRIESRGFATYWPRFYMPAPSTTLASFDPVHGDAAQQLRVKVRRFLRQNLTRGCNAHDLFDLASIEQKRNLRSAAVDRIEGRGGFALVGQILLRDHRLRRDAQRGLENAFVEQHDVEFALQRRDAGQKLRESGAGAQRQNVISALAGLHRGVDPDGAPGTMSFYKAFQEFVARTGLFGVVTKRERLGAKP